MPQYDSSDEQETSDTESASDTLDNALYWQEKNLFGDRSDDEDDPESRVSSRSSGRTTAKLEFGQVPEKQRNEPFFLVSD